MKYLDAVGYLNELAKEVGEEWFTMICDLAAISGKSSLDQQNRKTLFALFTDNARYLGIPFGMAPTSSTPTPVSTDFLETLSSFSNFKLLQDSLQVMFTKRLTLVFGANGSGKSSLCESLKVLASTEAPNRPLKNVRVTGTSTSGFNYKFRSDTAVQIWTEAIGYGPRCSTVKYFDTGIAVKNVKDSVELGRVIELTPFKLHIFEWVKALTAEFREVLQQAKKDNAAKLGQALSETRAEFAKFNDRPLSLINEKSIAELAAEIKTYEIFTQHDFLKEKYAESMELKKATSEEGLKLLKAEHRELDSFLSSISTLLNSAEGLWTLQPAVKVKDLATKQATQELLAKTLIPENGNLETFLALLRAALPLCNFEVAVHQTCPLCKRELNESEVSLFKCYHDLLAGELEKEIIELQADLLKAESFVKALGAINRNEWDKCNTLPGDILAEAKIYSELILSSCGLKKEVVDDAQKTLVALKALYAKGMLLLEKKAKAIETAEKGRNELVKQLTILQGEIEPLEYAQVIAARIGVLREVKRLADEAAFWESKLPPFTQLLRKITDASKTAYEELVVSDFETRLNTEYVALTEKTMVSFGVTLARKGSDASVTVLPKIGRNDINGVLSEGEQRVHALALFFAELEICPQSVIIFDDPISSFDYNYIANYCTRLRDLALRSTDRQIIVLTHNWEFFVQLQTTLNQANLNGHMSVQVLENCAVVCDYSENIDLLKTEITSILVLSGEPTKAQKEELAGKMRRLIEVVVNTHVFNNQRHQYKQKNQAVSDFQKFTKLVPLESTEATTLKDLYAKLSISEHDDPRSTYINTDKATFQSRFDRILAIEASVISRK